MRSRPGPLALRLAASLLLPAALAGCAAPGAAPAAPGTTAAAQVPSATVTVAPAVASAMAEGALSGEHCQKGVDGTWSYTATLSNQGAARAAFTVAIGLTRDTSVLDHALIQKTLAPGQTAQVSATGFGKDAPSAGTDCAAAVSQERTE
ncbi:hypothetical protein SA2016_1016 [Sinomonas atrocyanea]|uniref:Lipoprotein n=1 Tax=Sinomonas atrocyanea TaxID=37927 RepID=A0A126ZYP2_9MICC|nr:hypothetical protein [Sinomonas atrocyanea]AMM31701.1 hypothetical protein SA2016_1016 [Sinomonas atrocyanea]